MKDMHAGLDDAAEGPSQVMGERLADALVADATVVAVKRGRRVRAARLGVAASVSVIGLGALGAGAWSIVPRDEVFAPAAPSVLASEEAPKTPGDSKFVPAGPQDFPAQLNGPQDFPADVQRSFKDAGEGWKLDQTIPDLLACGADWTWKEGTYSGQYRGPEPTYDDHVLWEVEGGPSLDVADPQLNFTTETVAPDPQYYDTVVLAWVSDGVIVGNARMTTAVGPTVENTGKRATTVRGAQGTAAHPAKQLSGPGDCEAGNAPELTDGEFDLHVVHEYGPTMALIDGEQGGLPDEAIPSLPDAATVEFRSGDRFYVDVDPSGSWTVDVTGLDAARAGELSGDAPAS